MQIRSLLLLLALLLAACATDNSPQAECRRQANNDPEVKALFVDSLRNQSYAATHAGELAYLRRQATLRCLQDRGLASPGGVEPVRPAIP